MATIAACAYLWRRQTQVVPFAVGQVHVEKISIASPHDGIVQPDDAYPAGERPLYANIAKGDVAVRIERTNAAGAVDEVQSPISGSVSAVHAHAGQFVRKGDHILEIVSADSSYILCHLPDLGQEPPEPGEVDVRQRGRGARWVRTKIEAVGPASETTPTYEGVDIMKPERGIPLRIAAPKDVAFKPGSLVEVRFAPWS